MQFSGLILAMGKDGIDRKMVITWVRVVPAVTVNGLGRCAGADPGSYPDRRPLCRVSEAV